MSEPHILMVRDWSKASTQEVCHQLKSCEGGACHCTCGAALELARRMVPRMASDNRLAPKAPRPRIDLDAGPQIAWACPGCLRDCSRVPGVVKPHPIDGMDWIEGSLCAWCRLEGLGFQVRKPDQPGPWEVLTAEGEWKPWPDVIQAVAPAEENSDGD